MNKSSLTTTLIVVVVIIAVLGAGAVLAVILTMGGGTSGGSPAVVPAETPVVAVAPAIPSEEAGTPASPAAHVELPAELPAEPAAPAAPPANTQAPSQDTTWSYAIIKKIHSHSEAYVSGIDFDYVDWLYGQDAIDRFMEDYKCTQQQAKDETEEFGYIRNVNPKIRNFLTTANTRYYMQDAASDNITAVVQVDYNTFISRISSALSSGDDWPLFVKVTVSGDKVLEIEWVYHPWPAAWKLRNPAYTCL